MAFETLKTKLIAAPVLAYPDFDLSFVLESDASVKGLGAILSQRHGDGQLHPVVYASRSLPAPEKNYTITELETLAVVWAIQHFRAYLYAHEVTVITDHSAVRAILETPSPNGKHARWWLKVFGSGVGRVHIVYRPGKENSQADALSRNPIPTPEAQHEDLAVQVAQVRGDFRGVEIADLLEAPPVTGLGQNDFHTEQRKDPDLKRICDYIELGTLPSAAEEARKVTAQAIDFAVLDQILYYVDRKKSKKRAAVPVHLRELVMQESHGGVMAGHFAGIKLYNTLCNHWWWQTMYRDSISFCKNCAECAVVSGTGKHQPPPLHPIPVQRPFQIVGVDIMELPVTEKGNRYVVVFQDFLSKWPFVFAVPDQKAERLARLVVDEILPVFGVPEALLSDRGTNLLAHIMQDVCRLLGITKLNTTAYHPQCNGMIERLNRTLKAMLRKHAAKFGCQWDRYLPGVLWAYRNTPHEATKKKPSFLLFWVDCRTPTEAALLPPEPLDPADVRDYREELMLSLSSARELAAMNVRAAQKRYKGQHDKKAQPTKYQLGDWVLIRFPHEESGKRRKLSRPWHGPYRVVQKNDRVVQKNDPDISAAKVFFPEEGTIQVHQTRVCPCPPLWPAGFYWYGGNRKCAGRVPQWMQQVLSEQPCQEPQQTDLEVDQSGGEPDREPSPIAQDEESVDADPDVEETQTTSGTLLPPVKTRYSLRDRAHDIHPPLRYS